MMKKIATLILTVTLLASCQMNKITLDLYSQPDLVLPPEVTTVLVTSKYVPATGDYEHVQWGDYESVDSLKWMVSESIVDSLAAHLEATNKYRVKPVHQPRMLRHNGSELPEIQPWDGMENMAKKEYVRAILVLESYDLKRSDTEIKKTDRGHQAEFSVDMKVGFRFYEPIRRRLLDDSIYQVKKVFRMTGSSPQGAQGRLPADSIAFLLTADKAAKKYADMIAPPNISDVRYYYHKGDTLMDQAHQFVREDNWGRAETRWKWLAYKAEDTLTKARASYNMALACERNGRMNQAVGYARRAYRLHPDKKSQEYIAILEERIRKHEEEVSSGEKIKRW